MSLHFPQTNQRYSADSRFSIFIACTLFNLGVCLWWRWFGLAIVSAAIPQIFRHWFIRLFCFFAFFISCHRCEIGTKLFASNCRMGVRGSGRAILLWGRFELNSSCDSNVFVFDLDNIIASTTMRSKQCEYHQTATQQREKKINANGVQKHIAANSVYRMMEAAIWKWWQLLLFYRQTSEKSILEKLSYWVLAHWHKSRAICRKTPLNSHPGWRTPKSIRITRCCVLAREKCVEVVVCMQRVSWVERSKKLRWPVASVTNYFASPYRFSLVIFQHARPKRQIADVNGNRTYVHSL